MQSIARRKIVSIIKFKTISRVKLSLQLLDQFYIGIIMDEMCIFGKHQQSKQIFLLFIFNLTAN